jgi:hypothetical protein
MATGERFEVALYRIALYGYPPAFRREFADEMVRDFAQARREPHVTASARQVWAFRRRIAADLGRSVLVQWGRSGWPVILVLSLAGPILSGVAAGTLVKPARFTVPTGTDHDDLVALLVLVLLLLFVIVATIIFTFWFAHAKLRRRA